MQRPREAPAAAGAAGGSFHHGDGREAQAWQSTAPCLGSHNARVFSNSQQTLKIDVREEETKLVSPA